MKASTAISLFSVVLISAIADSSARTLKVGPGREFAKPSAAARSASTGDTVLFDAVTFPGDEAIWNASNLVLKGASKHAWMTAPSVISNRKAIWVTTGMNIRIENIRFSGAKAPDRNGAGIRAEGNDLKVVNCYFHDNENGILGGGNAYSNMSVENSEFSNNGAGDGRSHNMYISAIRSFALKFSNTHHAKVGHNVKSRAAINYILYNRILDGSDGTASYEVDLPNGGNSYVIGNIIQQGPSTGNSTILAYGAEGVTIANSALSVVNNTLVNDRSAGGIFVRFPAGFGPVRVMNNLFVGPGTAISGSAETSGNLSTNSPGFASRSAYDYRLTASSPAIDKGSTPGFYAGFDLTPVYQWSAATGGQPRPKVGPLDIGAYEYP